MPGRTLAGAHQAHGSHIVGNKGFAGELADCIQNRSAQCRGACRKIGQQALLYPLQAEFDIFGLIIPAFPFDHAARNQQKDRSFFQGHGGGFAGGVGKKAKGQAGGSEFGNTRAVAKKAGSMPGACITKRAKSFMVTADEGGTGVDACRSFHHAAIEIKTELDHGVGFVDIPPGKQFGPDTTKYFRGGGEDGLVVLAASGNIEQAKQNALRTDSQGVIEVSSDACAVGSSGDFSTLNLWELGRNGLRRWHRLGHTEAEEGTHSTRPRAESSTSSGGEQIIAFQNSEVKMLTFPNLEESKEALSDSIGKFEREFSVDFLQLFLAVLCLCAPGLSQVAALSNQPPVIDAAALVTKFEPYLQELSSKDEFSGVVLVAQAGNPVFQKAYGLQSQEYVVPNHLDTKFNLGSIDKIFTKIAIGQLLEQGKIASIDDKLERYLPDYPNHEAASTVTLRQILTMKSGIGDFFGPEFVNSPKDKFRSITDYLPLFAGQPLAFPPGSKRQYSNGGYIVLGAVIEKLTGQSYYDYVRDHIFKPLGMDNTDFYEGDGVTSNLASGYTREPGSDVPRRNNIYTRPAKGSSAGGGYSTAGDLLKFANAVDAGKIKNPAFDEDVARPANAPFASIRGIGIAGGAPGINAALEAGMPGGYTIVVLSNYDPPSAEVVSSKIREWMGLKDK